MEERLKNLLCGNAATLGVMLSDQHMKSLTIYFDLLHFWNKRINLFSPLSPEEFIIKHFVDSLAPAAFFDLAAHTIVDVGSGAGLPAIPLAIVSSPRSVAMVEATRKKASFLHTAVAELRLGNVEIIHRWLENPLPHLPDSTRYDFMTSRATASMTSLLRLAPHFLAAGGYLLAMKGPHATAELAAAQSICPLMGMSFAAQHSYLLPLLNHQRHIFVFRRCHD